MHIRKPYFKTGLFEVSLSNLLLLLSSNKKLGQTGKCGMMKI